MATKPANANGHRRRQIRNHILATQNNCALCGKPVNKTLTMQWGTHSRKCKNPKCPGCIPHPMRAEIDEIIPRSKGGSPLTATNTQLTHRQCNLQKSIQATTKQNQTPRIQYPTTTNW